MLKKYLATWGFMTLISYVVLEFVTSIVTLKLFYIWHEFICKIHYGNWEGELSRIIILFCLACLAGVSTLVYVEANRREFYSGENY